jgi:SAM-dependent methyltransferase
VNLPVADSLPAPVFSGLMLETTDPEIDVERLMAEIRETVAEHEAAGRRSLVGASVELREIISTIPEPVAEAAELSTLKLQPDFVESADHHYHINDLLQYHDHTFVWNAYRAILKREPDEAGLREFLNLLRSGRYNKIDVLASLRFSPEGMVKDVRIDGLTRRPLFRRLYRLPVLGYLLEMIVGIARLPKMIHSHRQFETHAMAQQELLATHINQLKRTSFQVSDSFPREVAKLSTEQRRIAELQHRHLVGVWREQREIIERLERLKEEMDARLISLRETISASSPEASGQALSLQAAVAENRAVLDELLASFADEFRGASAEIKEGFRVYLPMLKEAGIEADILDIGCGRGEWLELLAEEGFAGRGVESNRVLVERGRSRGLEIIEEDALRYLRALPDGSLNAVTGFHVIEHLRFKTLIELLDEIARTLRPNGLVIFETPNPKNLVVGACNFYSDPTHLKPLFPETVRFILSHRGFAEVRIEYVNPVGESPFKDESETSRALDSWFYSPRDFAVIGKRQLTADAHR